MNSPDALDLSGFRKPSKPAPTPTGEEGNAEPATIEAVPEKTQPEAAARPDSGSVSKVTVRGLSPRDRGVLDELVDEVGAANLTELITVALDAHLPAPDPTD